MPKKKIDNIFARPQSSQVESSPVISTFSVDVGTRVDQVFDNILVSTESGVVKSCETLVIAIVQIGTKLKEILYSRSLALLSSFQKGLISLAFVKRLI